MSVSVSVSGPPQNCDILRVISYSSSLTLSLSCVDSDSPIIGYLLYFNVRREYGHFHILHFSSFAMVSSPHA